MSAAHDLGGRNASFGEHAERRRRLRMLDRRLDAILARPGMWGAAEAVEMQVVTLLDLRAEIKGCTAGDPRWLHRRWVALLASRGTGNLPLSGHAPVDLDALTVVLADFRKRVVSEMERTVLPGPRLVLPEEA